MTKFAQYLNVLWGCSQGWFRAMRPDVMALQIRNAVTFFAFAALSNNFRNNFSNAIRTLACSASPLWMVFFSHFSAASFCHTWNRAVFSSPSSAFANLKKNIALFALAINHRFRFARLYFVRTRNRASVCFSSYVCIRSSKIVSAYDASKVGAASVLNCSLEISHG